MAIEENKINESIRSQQHSTINELKTEIRRLRKVIMVPRLHTKYVNEVNKMYQKEQIGMLECHQLIFCQI